jgi:hypothetical protein
MQNPTMKLYPYIWLVYVYFGLSADFDYPRQFSPQLPRIIESLLYHNYMSSILPFLVPENKPTCHFFNEKGCRNMRL